MRRVTVRYWKCPRCVHTFKSANAAAYHIRVSHPLAAQRGVRGIQVAQQRNLPERSDERFVEDHRLDIVIEEDVF